MVEIKKNYPAFSLFFFPLFHSLGAFVTLSYLYIVPVCVG